MEIDFQLKQRLVGIAVVVSLAVIFLPLLLDGAGMVEKPQYKQLAIEVPPAPIIKQRKVDFEKESQQTKQILENIPKKKETSVQKNEIQKKPLKQKSKSVQTKKTVAPKKPLENKTNSKKEEGWVVQVGSFKDQEKAFNLQKTVRSYKIADVFIQKIVIDKATSYRVRMGPFLYKKQASAAVKKLKDKYKMKSFVRKHSK